MRINKKTSRILVLTLQPLGLNYGGTIQAYALQRALGNLGYEAKTQDESDIYSKLKGVTNTIKYFISNKTIKRASDIKRYHIPTSILTKNTKSFVDKRINTEKRPGLKALAEYEAVIVGSDQVWRRDYADICKYLLDFTSNIDITRISYAASFGKDDISDYGHDLLVRSKRLAQRFDAISVREDNAIAICKTRWGVDAVQVLDPTMLLSKSDYIELIEQENTNHDNDTKRIFSYILDSGETTREIDNVIGELLKFPSYRITPPLPKNYRDLIRNPGVYAWPSIASWLQGFRQADFVVTDSFHGTVFSIIFNKPFVAIGNTERGMSRFISLLSLFGLENRLVSSASEVTKELLNTKINWDKVNAIKEREQKRSLDYLKKHLGDVEKAK